MEKLSTKIALFVLIISAVVWLGAVNVRAVVGNELLNFGTLEFKDHLDAGLEREVFRLISLTSVIVIVGYLATFISAVVFIKTTSLKFKRNGWLMMGALLFFIFSPVEFYTLVLDWKMITLDFFSNASLTDFRILFIHRLAALAGVPIIALLSYYTIVGLVIWQPLKKPQESTH